MSDELRKEEETEVEGHVRSAHKANEEPDVEAHRRHLGAEDKPSDEADDDVEGHVRSAHRNARLD
jgi:hypothetical protein